MGVLLFTWLLLQITAKNTFHRDNFLAEDNHESNNDEKTCLRYICRLLISNLTLRSQNARLYTLFESYLTVGTFKPLSLEVKTLPLEARTKLIKFYTKL